MLRSIICLVLLIGYQSLSAQTNEEPPSNNRWTLERSVAYALNNNIQVKQLELRQRGAEATLDANRLSRLPNVDANVGYGIQLGRTIDPTTNSFEQQNITFNNLSLGAGMIVYNGGRINNSIKQSKLDAQAARLETEATANDVALAVANAYLTVLLAREQLSNARAQLQLTTDQLTQTEAGIRAGSLPESQRFDLIAQRAANERSIVDFENQVRLGLVNLQLTMQLNPREDFNIITPDLEVSERDLVEEYTFDEVYLAASQTQPDLKAAQLRNESARYGEKVAKAGYLPSLTARASLNSNFSSLGRQADTSNLTFVPGPAVPVIIDGQQSTIQQFEVTGLTFEDKPYFDQISENFGQSLALNLAIPIFSQGRNDLALQQARIQTASSQLDAQQAEIDLRNEVIRALTDLRAARTSYRAAQTSLDAAQQSYDVTQRRFDLGAANNLDLLTATNRLEQARIERTRSKFQLIFNQQVIEFYLGRPLRLD